MRPCFLLDFALVAVYTMKGILRIEGYGLYCVQLALKGMLISFLQVGRLMVGYLWALVVPVVSLQARDGMMARSTLYREHIVKWLEGFTMSCEPVVI